MATTLTYYGHSAIGLDLDGTRILVDPFFTGNPVAKTKAEDIQKLDYILITHGHSDHVGDAVELARRTGATIISNFEIYLWLSKQGVEKLHPQHIGGGYHHPFGYVKLTIAHHGSCLPDGSDGGNPAGFLIRAKNGKKFYFSGDTALTRDMELLAEEQVDLAALPIGDNFTMGPDDAVKAVRMVQPKRVLPIHYNTWPLIAQDARAFAAQVAAKTDATAVTLEPGQTLSID